MCELKAYLRKNDTEELILEAVNSLRVEGEQVLMKNLFGEEKSVRGMIREVSLAKNRVIVEQR